MGVDDPDRREARLNRHLQRQTPHAAPLVAPRPGQQVSGDLQDRQPRQRHVAEAMHPALAVDGLDGRTKHRLMIRQQRGQLPALVGTAVETGKLLRYLLKAEYIGIGNRPGGRNDPCEIDNPVAAFAPLNVPGDQAHHRIPARMNDCTNWRWNSRKAISSGAMVITVAAVMIDQSTPVSGAPNTASPTVSGRLPTELVTISGQRKLFQ